jgi:putative ABC transport system permease protein
VWKFAFRNVFRHRTRTLLTLGAVAFGVISLIVSTGFIGDFLLQLREATIHSQYGHLQVYKRGYYELGRRAPYEYMIDDAGKWIAELERIEHVVAVTQRINLSGLLSNGRTTYPVVGEGVDPIKEQRLSNYMRFIEGQQFANDAQFSIIIGQGVANALNLKVGDSAILLVNTRGGALNTFDFKVVGIFQSFSKEYDDRAVRIPLVAAQELLATQAAHSLVFLLSDTGYTDDVAREVASRLPQATFEIKRWIDLADFYQKSVELYRRYFTVLYLIILGLVLLSVANNVNMTIYERTGEFGTLLALGNRSRSVFKLIVQESLFLGLVGATLGLSIGIVIALLISAIGISMPPMPNTNSGYVAHIQIVPREVITAFAIGLFSTVGAALLPACRASRLSIAEALRHN